MKRFLLLIFVSLVTFKSQSQNLARGADIGWLSEMEQSGRIWRDSLGIQRDLLDILDDYCINTIRLRVWVNPANAWSGKQDVISLAKRATAKGIPVVRASRVPIGPVLIEGEIDDKEYGTISSDQLNPQKARVLLMLALLKERNREELQELFINY